MLTALFSFAVFRLCVPSRCFLARLAAPGEKEPAFYSNAFKIVLCICFSMVIMSAAAQFLLDQWPLGLWLFFVDIVVRALMPTSCTQGFDLMSFAVR